MKQIHFLFVVFVVLFLSNTLVAQKPEQNPDRFVPRGVSPFKILPSPNFKHTTWNPTITKRSGHYTKQDWKNLIDSLWGPGISTTEKLKIFDDYWNMVDQTWGSFPNLVINWDSLRDVYRPEVAVGVSRGRFYGILSRLTRALNEWHVYTVDLGIDSAFGFIGDQFPIFSSYKYQSGIPIFNAAPTLFRTNFGAGITPLPDSTALVYSVMPNHPLDLKPGDIILGYDRIPWKYLVKEILDAELPIIYGGSGLASTTQAASYAAIRSVGMNWGLFDTIDIFKFSTKDTVHFPTSLLKTIVPPYHIATEQLPVNGVAFPNYDEKKLVSWGVVEGTTIGYIYVWDWWGVPKGNTRILFGQAVDELLHIKNVSGLIIDFRKNNGGDEGFANDGFKQLFNFDPTSNYSSAIRTAGSNHNAFTFLPPWNTAFFTPGNAIFDHPIAVLTGPLCGSAGDYNAFRMRFHPMVRFFGKRTNGAYTDYSVWKVGIWNNSYKYRVDNGSVYSNYNNEGPMTHKSFPVDEDVWLTQAGVAKGEDGVVKSALEWINTLAYAHNITALPLTVRSGIDSISITSLLENPMKHNASIIATLSDSTGKGIDSVVLHNDGLHGDGKAGDSLWGAYQKVPNVIPQIISVSIRTNDLTTGTSRSLPNVAHVAVNLMNATRTKGFGDGTVSILIADPAQKTDHLYRVTIDDSSFANKVYTVRDITLGGIVKVQNATQFDGTTPGPLFDGLRLIVGDITNVDVDSKNTKWIIGSGTLDGQPYLFSGILGSTNVTAKALPNDYTVTIANTVVDTSIAIFDVPATPMKFQVRNVTKNRKAKILFAEGDGNNTISSWDEIHMLEPDSTGALILSWGISFVPNSLYTQPVPGDQFYFKTLKPLSSADVYEFTLKHTSVARYAIPTDFYLTQNYPNPFNPSTTIRYSLPSTAKVKLVVYDLLGREIATLVNEEQSAGWKDVEWNAKNVSSGIYLVRMRADNFVDVKKMLVVK